ncbi:hypothetical protein FNF27_07484 [Cafeteria roenbergensis]|uniref:Uncharacterized protein n=1 Tax=Cafeteria roenbergensis TaxID=33653 RepID=A0A5A8DPK5_CAFRO|nr:hypothetical protein FNF27_07484 [Cafeteria roenbergensis]
MMELRSDDESSDDMEATANLVEEFIRACKGARCLAAATGFEGFLPDTLGKLPGELKAKLRKCLYGDGVTARANEQTEAPWQRKMVLHHDDMLRIKHECVFLRRLAKARRACTARCRAEALAKGTTEKRVANIDDPAMLRVMSDLVAFREACVPGTHYWLRNTMMGPRGLTDEEFAVVGRYRIGASEADHVVPDGVSINCACMQRDTTARGTVHIGGVSGVAHHLARCRCGKGSTIRAHNDVRDVLHAAITSAEADLHAARVKKRYQLAHVWRSDIAGAVEGLEELRAEIEELALEAMMELGSDDESSDDMEATANLVEEFIRACKGARCLAAATGFEGFLPDTLGKLPGELKAKLRKCLYGDGVTARANEQTEAPWQRKMVLHHDDMLRIKHECVFLRRLAKARRACTARCRAEALAKGTPEKRVANIDDPAMLRVMSDLVAFREACVPGTHYWLRNTMMGPRGLTDEEFAVVERYRIGASEADHVVPDGVSINCACVQRDTTARGTVHIGGVSGVAHHLARCRCGKGSTIRAHNDVRDVLHAAITSAVSKSYVTQGLQNMDAFLERQLRAEIEELALEAMMELGSDDASSDDMEATANLVEDFIRACKGARCLAAATGFEGFLPDTLGKLPGELKAKLRKCLYGDGVTARANEQTEAPWQRKMVLHHDDMLRIKHECVFLRRLAKARRACTARCRAEALAKGTPEKRVANIDDPAMLRVMSDLVAFREACVPGTHYWLRNTMMGPRGLTDEEFAVVTRYRIGASEADHVVPDGVSINCACMQRDTTARGTVHIGGVSGITSAVSKSYVTQGLQNMDAFLERHEEFAVVTRYRIGASEADHVVPDGVSINCACMQRDTAARGTVHIGGITSAVSKSYVTQGLQNMDAFLERRPHRHEGPLAMSRRVMSDLVAFREACVPGTHYWLRNTMMGPRGLTDEEFAVVTRYRIGASEADHVVPDGVSINYHLGV